MSFSSVVLLFVFDALSKSNFNVQLEYEQQNNTRKRHNRQRNVLWYNPPYSKNVKTNLAQNVADITTTDNNDTKTYIGVTSNDFKTRYRNHCKSINNIKYRNETELSKHIWQIKENGRSYEVKWGIIKQFTTPFNSKKSYLCLEEKLLILKSRKKLLNKRSDLFNTCRHVAFGH